MPSEYVTPILIHAHTHHRTTEDPNSVLLAITVQHTGISSTTWLHLGHGDLIALKYAIEGEHRYDTNNLHYDPETETTTIGYNHTTLKLGQKRTRELLTRLTPHFNETSTNLDPCILLA